MLRAMPTQTVRSEKKRNKAMNSETHSKERLNFFWWQQAIIEFDDSLICYPITDYNIAKDSLAGNEP